jgi:hypothetical protein
MHDAPSGPFRHASRNHWSLSLIFNELALLLGLGKVSSKGNTGDQPGRSEKRIMDSLAKHQMDGSGVVLSRVNMAEGNACLSGSKSSGTPPGREEHGPR